jgi:IclR family acetate operon transcriptional repressor
MAVLSRAKAHVLEKGAALLNRIVRNEGSVCLRDQAADLGLPLSTAYRLVATYLEMGWICRRERGCYGAGLGLLDLAQHAGRGTILAGVARPLIRQLSRRLGQTIHFGILEDDMVTYLVKEGESVSAGFTREGMQLEAYGSGIGKILLAHMPSEARELYLHSGPFVPLTANTIIHPDRLRIVLNKARTNEYALDVGEVSENLWCLAVPVRDRHNRVVAAMSVSRLAQADKKPLDRGLLRALQRCARDIQGRL